MKANDPWPSAESAESAQDEPIGAVDAADVLKRLQDSALGLLAGLDRPPRSLRIRVNGVELEMEWPDAAPATAPVDDAPSTPGQEPAGQHINAHMVGVFYRCPEPGAKPFVEPGDIVAAGQQVGIIEAMKLMMPVEAETAGRIVDVLVADGASVEYGDRLFAVEPAEK